MNENYFVYTGNAYPHKNLERLIDAIVLIKSKLKIISGRNVFTKRLEKLILNKKADQHIEILGFTNDKVLEEIYKNSIAFVFPTLAEGFGLPPMEAINAGTISVISNIPVLKEVYGESVFYFDPYDTNSITGALVKVLKLSGSDRKAKILKAQKFLSKYSWKKMAEDTLKVYEGVV